MNNLLTMRNRTSPRRLGGWVRENFGGGGGALCQTGVVIAALAGGTALAATFWPRPVGYALACAAALAALELAVWAARRLLRRLTGRELDWLMGLGLLYCAVAYTVERGAGEGWTWRVLLFALFAAGAAALLAVSWRSAAAGRRAGRITAALSSAAVGLLTVFLFADGFDDFYIRRYLALAPRQERGDELPLGMGPLATAALDYGPGETLEAGTIDLSGYMSRDTGDLVGSYVDAYWDYDLTAVPMRGRVWYPAEGKNCPVLFIAHGNHEIATESYLGYDYLGEYLASYGYVVVSVDQNACNMLTGENDGRAVLLLEHIGLLLDYNAQAGGPLYGTMDPEALAIAGHSRGGEMVATAYLFNGYEQYPENGTIRFDYHYNIKSVIAIAPTVDQYRPADHSVRLEDVNYLLLHGAADRDVTRFMGMTQYDNISFTGEGQYLKTALYIAGANHGQFNSLWGAYDQSGPFAPLLNVNNMLSEEEQQMIARVFVKVFLDVTLLGDGRCRDLLTDWDSYGAQLPETVYVQCWETSGLRTIADFEEDSDLSTGTLEGTELSAEGVYLWREELAGFGGRDTHAARLHWRGAGTYRADFPEMDMRGGMVRFDLCDLDSGAVERGELSLLDGEVVLTDGGGRSARARISDFSTVFPIMPVRTDKLDFIFDTRDYKKAFATVAIPAEAFDAQEGFDAGGVAGLSITFDGSGQVLLDNIGVDAPFYSVRRNA